MEKINEIYLSNHKDFVKVDNKYYGGNQKWLYTEKLRGKFWADRSCGVVASSNCLIHLSNYKDKYRGIYNYHDLSKLNYVRFTNELYKHIKPRIYGVHNLYRLNRGLKSFVRQRGFNIDSSKMSNPRDLNRTINFIKSGLKNDSPVLMLTWNSDIKNLKYHWVTITGYYKSVQGENFIISSNSGRMETFSLDLWLRSRSFYKGLIYF